MVRVFATTASLSTASHVSPHPCFQKIGKDKTRKTENVANNIFEVSYNRMPEQAQFSGVKRIPTLFSSFYSHHCPSLPSASHHCLSPSTTSYHCLPRPSTYTNTCITAAFKTTVFTINQLRGVTLSGIRGYHSRGVI